LLNLIDALFWADFLV
jgi:potassium voltage-gated channel Eag-related subfamily H protein 8